MHFFCNVSICAVQFKLKRCVKKCIKASSMHLYIKCIYNKFLTDSEVLLFF